MAFTIPDVDPARQGRPSWRLDWTVRGRQCGIPNRHGALGEGTPEQTQTWSCEQLWKLLGSWVHNVEFHLQTSRVCQVSLANLFSWDSHF